MKLLCIFTPFHPVKFHNMLVTTLCKMLKPL